MSQYSVVEQERENRSVTHVLVPLRRRSHGDDLAPLAQDLEGAILLPFPFVLEMSEAKLKTRRSEGDARVEIDSLKQD